MNVRELIELKVKFNTREDRCEECERTLRELLYKSIKYISENDFEMKFEIGSHPRSRICNELNEDATQFVGWLKREMKKLPPDRHQNEVFVAIIVRHITVIMKIGFEAYIESIRYEHH